jgi:N-glycosylase/DNA lyase
MPLYKNTAILSEEYQSKKKAIKRRLKDFDRFKNLSEKELFEELAFCLFTPGSRALNGSKAVMELKKKHLLFSGSRHAAAKVLRGIVRFHNNKAAYLSEARKNFKKGNKFNVSDFIFKTDPLSARGWLVENIKGLGFKEASHFLRNIGLGEDLAILDTHILKNLKKFNVIKKVPVSISKKQYIDIEARMCNFSKHIGIPMSALDLLFWSHETGFIYK